MREALAAADHDFVLVEPASISKPNRVKASAAKRRGSGRQKLRTRRYIGFFASALCVAIVAGIVINALTLQKTRHPAPLFARALPAQSMKEPAIAEIAVPIPVPAPRPQPGAAAAIPGNDRSIEKPLLEKPVNARPHQAPAAPTGELADAKPRDPISQLLKTNGHEPRPAPPAGPSKTVLAAQRALLKLGFVVKPDGVAGATTRQAIERFERDNGLAVHGELTPVLLRRLSAESGIAIQ